MSRQGRWADALAWEPPGDLLSAEHAVDGRLGLVGSTLGMLESTQGMARNTQGVLGSI